jgi:SH3 domain-containing YSC84-like protein 1
LVLINYSARADASLGKADVIFWSDNEGAFAGVSLGASAIAADEEANRAF